MDNEPYTNVDPPKPPKPAKPAVSFNQSQDINELAAALAKAQAKIVPAKKTESNPFFKSNYADLSACVAASRGPLAEQGIAVIQGAFTEGPKVSIITRLAHSSGQWIECCTSANSKDPLPQSVGSVITYLRRYGLSAMVGIATEDDDGNAGTRSSARRE